MVLAVLPMVDLVEVAEDVLEPMRLCWAVLRTVSTRQQHRRPRPNTTTSQVGPGGPTNGFQVFH